MERASGLGRILVVDDSASDRMVIRKALDRIGCETLVDAVSGEDALARLRAEEFDVVISDYSLGFMDGISLLEIVRRDAPRACRVLVTGHAHFDLARDAINRAGVHAFLEKPVEPAKLKAAIETAMARSRAEHPSV